MNNEVRKPLKEALFALSTEDVVYDQMVKEWEFVELVQEQDHCACSMRIHRKCYIKNITNGNTTFVGSDCLYKITGIDVNGVFAGINTLRKRAYEIHAGAELKPRRPSKALLDHCIEHNLITDGEVFSIGKLNLKYPMGQDRMNEINEKILVALDSTYEDNKPPAPPLHGFRRSTTTKKTDDLQKLVDGTSQAYKRYQKENG